MFQGARAQESILGERWRLRRGGHQCGYYLLYSATGVIVDLGREVTSEPSTSPEDRYASGPLVDLDAKLLTALHSPRTGVMKRSPWTLAYMSLYICRSRLATTTKW